MRIGLLSDSHGQTDALRAALDALTRHEVSVIVHCGDIVSLQCVYLLTATGLRSWLVAGNMDRHLRHQLEGATQGTLVTCGLNTVEVPIGGDEYVVATHGHDDDLLDGLIRGQHFPYVCHGHTHRMANRQVEAVRVICPGAVSGPRYPSFPTVAVLDTDTDGVNFYDIAHPDQPIRMPSD